VEFIDFFCPPQYSQGKIIFSRYFSIIKLFLKKKNICPAFGFLFFLTSKILKLGITTKTPKLIV
jgi:hypothetical protein